MSSDATGRALPVVMLWKKTSETNAPGSIARKVPPDDELMLRLQAGSHDALGVLFDRYSRLVLSVALRILHDYGEAEDVVQDSFFYLYQKAALFDPAKGTLKAWISQIGLHRALDRKSYLRLRGLNIGTEIDFQEDSLLAETDLEREIGARLNRALLEKAFEGLPEVQRKTIDLFYFEGLDLREISTKLGEPWENVRHHFYRGLQRLRKSALVRRLREK